MIKALAAALTGLALSFAAPVISDERRIEFRAIAMIQCGASRGTAFWVTGTILASARHVTANGPCFILPELVSGRGTSRSSGEGWWRGIDGAPVRVIHEDAARDFALLRGPRNRHPLAVGCRGFREGRAFWATGWAQGLYRHTARLVATGGRSPGEGGGAGLRILVGEVYPGMSGGPVVDASGRVVGIVNRRAVMAPLAQSRSLADTILCRRRWSAPGVPARPLLRKWESEP